MAEFKGKFQYLMPGGAAGQEGECRIAFDKQTLTLTASNGSAIVCDLGDVESLAAADWEIRLSLFTDRVIVLRQLGKAYETLKEDLLHAYRDRLVECLLLEDLQEVERFAGNFELISSDGSSRSGPAEFRLYKSNLAVLPTTTAAFQWRLAEVDASRFDPGEYEVTVESAGETLKITHLAKRTEEFSEKLNDAMQTLTAQGMQALHAAFPLLDPDQLQSAYTLLREGRAAPVGELIKIHPKFRDVLFANAVDASLKPYFDRLLSRTASESLYAGYKLVRPEGEKPSAKVSSSQPDNTQSDQDEESVADSDASDSNALCWFFFPIAIRSQASNVVAWEASSSGGRATYFFRLPGTDKRTGVSNQALDAGIRRLNRVLGLLNFRRRPIYLSDDELARDAKYLRYAIAARRMPEVREIRSCFLGRASHTSPDAWQTQVTSILSAAGL